MLWVRGKGHIAKNCPSRVNHFVEDTPDAHGENEMKKVVGVLLRLKVKTSLRAKLTHQLKVADVILLKC